MKKSKKYTQITVVLKEDFTEELISSSPTVTPASQTPVQLKLTKAINKTKLKIEMKVEIPIHTK